MKRESLEKQVEVFFYKSRGPGGQRKNKRETAVRLLHIPTGTVSRATEYRSQAANRELAFTRLLEKLANLERKKAPRIPTGKSRAVKLREKEKKQKLSMKKRERSRPLPEENI